MPQPIVQSLHSYPVKSCRGVNLLAGTVERRGFSLDRRFMVVDDEGLFRTQRGDPLLATVDVGIQADRLRLGRAGAEPCEVPLAQADAGAIIDVHMRSHIGAAHDQGEGAAAWLSELLGAPSRLVCMPDDLRRVAGPAASGDDIVGFADAYPFLLTSTASLGALQQEMDELVPMNRFRANIVVDGAAPWLEDSWSQLRIGEVTFAIVADCLRCVVTTTDQRTGERGREPLRTLGRLRRTDGGVRFGRYLVPLGVGRVNVGDAVNITGR